jgi:hypothetical protein
VDDAALDPAEHLDACADCRTLAERDRQATPAQPALPGRQIEHVQEERSMTLALPSQRWRIALSGLAVALVLMLALWSPHGRGTAAQILAQFRGERFAAVSLSSHQIANIEETLAELERLGSLSGIDTAPELRTVASVAEASRFVGFPVIEPDPASSLPAGINATPTTVRVMPAHQIRFTFDLHQTRAYYQSIGRSDVTVPDRFHGASLVVNTPPAVLLEYRSGDTPVDTPFGFGMVVGQTGTVTASAEGGVTLEELREFLLGLPGLSPETARQLRAIDDWQTTLPVPIPVDHIHWQRATIAGSPGLLLNDNTGLGSAAIWQRDGRIFGIAGAMKARELQHVAESLR